MTLWGYLSCADRTELQKLFKLSPETNLIRNQSELVYNKPFPYTQSKEQRTVSVLYIAVATGSLDCLSILAEELLNVNFDDGIEIRKKAKEDNDFLIPKTEKTLKKRTPL